VPSPNDTPTGLLAALVGSDPTRPRLTWYDDQPGPTQGERIELSGRVLGNWAAKAANLLQDDLDAGPGTVVEIDLPTHWRAAYWLFAAWSVGAEVVVGASLAGHHPDVVVTDDPGDWAGGGEPLVAVTLAALARGWAGAPLPTGAVDEAKELATYGDRFQAYATPAPDAVALRTPAGSLSYAGLVPAARVAAEAAGLDATARVLTSATPDRFVETLLAAWVVDGSVVLVRDDQSLERREGKSGLDDAGSARRASAERVTYVFS
jgi:uncharacterized protein (TIGR03089 family)